MFQFQLCTMYLVAQIQLVRLLLIKLQCVLHWASHLGPAIADVCKYVYTSIPSLLLCIIHSLFCVGTGFCKLLQQCNNQQKQHTTNLEDICDGNRYQLLLQNGYLVVYTVSPLSTQMELQSFALKPQSTASGRSTWWSVSYLSRRYTSIAEN